MDGTFTFTGRPGRYLVAAIAPGAYQVKPSWPSFAALAGRAR